ncbi:hypothetical protein LXL04_019142 [Taraxacum kok-saghyz]
MVIPYNKCVYVELAVYESRPLRSSNVKNKELVKTGNGKASDEGFNLVAYNQIPMHLGFVMVVSSSDAMDISMMSGFPRTRGTESDPLAHEPETDLLT